jgi:hypothetical protein
MAVIKSKTMLILFKKATAKTSTIALVLSVLLIGYLTIKMNHKEQNEYIDQEISTLFSTIGIETSVDMKGLLFIEDKVSSMYSSGRISRKTLTEDIYLPLLLFIGEVYKAENGGHWVFHKFEKSLPVGYSCSSSGIASDFLAVYMSVIHEFAPESGYIHLKFAYDELASECG